MSDPLLRTQPVFTFHTALALRVGVEAAVLYEFIQGLSRLQSSQPTGSEAAEGGVTAAEDQWLAWTPFLSPAGFMTAIDTLATEHLVTCRENRNAGTLTLVAHDQTGQAPDSDAVAPAASESAPPAQSRSQLPHQTHQRVDHSADPGTDDWAEYDMPPPMPTIRPLLTDHTTVLDTYQQPRPRYSDEPLYAMQRKEPGAEQPDGDTLGTTPNAPENTLMHLDWQPSQDCTQMIRNKGIEIAFALAQRESFVLYYRDSGQRNMSWDTKFFNWVTRRWQYHLNDQNQDSQAHAQHPQSDESTARQRKQKLRAKLRDIGDLDW